MDISGSRLLVTGGSGFIGSHLVDLLTQEDVAQIVVFDKAIRHSNLTAALKSRKVKLTEGDIKNIADLREVMKDIDGVFHLAALPIGTSAQNPRACLEINVNGTFNVLEVAKEVSSPKKIVFSSASSVYGDTIETMDESHPLNAKTIYGASKIAGEFFLRAFYDMYSLDYTTLRYMNVYGPRQEGGLVMNVLKRIKSGQPPVIFGDGTQSFDFIYVEDIAAANIAAMKSQVTDEVFNVGSGTEATVKEVVELLLELTGSNLKPEFKLDEKVPMQRRVGSNEKAAKFLNFRASVSLKDGLKRVIDWLENM